MPRVRDLEKLDFDDDTTPQERNFIRMRFAERTGVEPNVPAIWALQESPITKPYINLRLRDPIHTIACSAFYNAVFFEHAHDPDMKQEFLKSCANNAQRRGMQLQFVQCSNPDFAIRSFAKATLMDETVIVASSKSHGKGAIQDSYPLLLAALRKAIANRQQDPDLAAQAYIGLSFFALVDPSVGDHIKLLEPLLEPSSRQTSLRPYLKDEASVVCRHAVYKLLCHNTQDALKHITKAIELAKKQEQNQRHQEASGRRKPPFDPNQYDFSGLTWYFSWELGMILHRAGRYAKALEVIESVIDAVDTAFRDFPDDLRYDPMIGKAPASPVTGGRERDPEKLAKLVSLEFCAASILLSAYLERKTPDKTRKSRREYLSEKKNRIAGDTKELRRRGLARYKSAAEREATLPLEALSSMDGTHKMVCQGILVRMPATKETEAAVNAGAGRVLRSGASLLECYGCGSTRHEGLKTCGGCMQAAYCSITCQKTHWKVHKVDCKKRQTARTGKERK